MFVGTLPIVSAPLIGLMGKKRTGKSTLARFLHDNFGYECVAFADPLRDLVTAANPILKTGFTSYTVRVQVALAEHGYEITKDRFPEYRRLLQAVGNGVRDVVGANVWVDIAMRRVNELQRAGVPVVVTDVRFPNEATAIHAAGGITARIFRDTGLSYDPDISEHALDNRLADEVVDNRGSLADLAQQAATLNFYASSYAVD